MISRFLLYGLLGWGMEIIWTGIHSFLQKDYRLTCTTSLWMFFIYGLAVFLEPFFSLLSHWPLVLRGGVYMIFIFMAEYATGWWLKGMIGACPWDYSGNRYAVGGLIRLDYAPIWFIVGLLYEKIYFALLARI